MSETWQTMVSSHFAESRFAECRLRFSFHHFHFKFLSLMRHNLFIGVNEMRVKNITVTVSVRVSVTVRVSLVWRHRHFLFSKISKWHGFSANCVGFGETGFGEMGHNVTWGCRRPCQQSHHHQQQSDCRPTWHARGCGGSWQGWDGRQSAGLTSPWHTHDTHTTKSRHTRQHRTGWRCADWPCNTRCVLSN